MWLQRRHGLLSLLVTIVSLVDDRFRILDTDSQEACQEPHRRCRVATLAFQPGSQGEQLREVAPRGLVSRHPKGKGGAKMIPVHAKRLHTTDENRLRDRN